MHTISMAPKGESKLSSKLSWQGFVLFCQKSQKMAKKVLGNSVTEFSILEISGAKNPGNFCPLKKKSWNFLKKNFLNSMKNWYSWNFLVPEFSILQYSVWKFSVLGFYFPENSGIRCQVCRARGGGPSTVSITTDANLDCAFVENTLFYP